MADFLQHFLIATAAVAVLIAPPATARKFYPDDPLLKEPAPLPVGKLKPGRIGDAGDFIHNSLHEPAQAKPKGFPAPPLDVNSLDELPDSSWYTNRVGSVSGSDGTRPPSMDKPWMIYQAKLEGVTPGFRIKDSTGERYVIKFDPKENIEMATAADVIGSKFFFALGYNVPDNYAVRFRRQQLLLGENIKFVRDGQDTTMQEADLDHLLSKVPQYPDGSYRGLASRFIPGDILGPFQYYGTRRDDPNDTIPHERLRVLRALYVFCAWLDHTDSRAINTLDAIQETGGLRAVRHYLIDFGAILGSDSLTPKQAWQGHTYTIDFKWGLLQMATLGLHPAVWETMRYGDLPSIGKYEAGTFEPGTWKPNYPNPAFDNRTPADCFWAARQVMSFTGDQIRAIVATGDFSNPQAVEDLTRVIIERRDKIGKYYFAQVLPLDRFVVAGGKLAFKDWGGSGAYQIAWSGFNNDTGAKTPMAGETSFVVPTAPGYLAGDLTDGTHRLTVYTLNGRVVGVDR